MTDSASLELSGQPEPDAAPTDVEVLDYLEIMQKIGNKLLIALHDACVKLDIDYFVYSGTLLGVERYGDWIPWDDDVDVAMFREDLEVLRQHAVDVLPPDIRYSDLRTDPDHATKFVRLLYLPSERSAHDSSAPSTAPDIQHVVLDIFVLDRAPRSAWATRLWQGVIKVVLHLALSRDAPIRTRRSESHRVVRRIYRRASFVVSRLLPSSTWRRLHHQACTFFERRGRSDTFAGTNHHKASFGKLQLHASDFLPAAEKQFGDITVRCPARADEILRKMYGESYMTPPPAAEQRPMHRRQWVRARIDGVDYCYESCSNSRR
jgi:lipopolysaccharide cholinephosphotransferase